MTHVLSFWTYIRCLFSEMTATELAEKQLNEAKREELMHASAAKYHEAMAGYYRQSVTRLSNYKG